MRLISHRVDGATRSAVVVGDGTAIDTAALGPDLPGTMADLIDGGDAALAALRRATFEASPPKPIRTGPAATPPEGSREG